MTKRTLLHARTHLALHELAHRDGPNLLLLHSLYGSSAEWIDATDLWPGSVYALDFCGHGESDALPGGAYAPELLAADADTALRELGHAYVAGSGVGAYAALLLAGGRAEKVVAALLFPGGGLTGGGPAPEFERAGDLLFRTASPHESPSVICDPLVRALEHDIRPPHYASVFATAARRIVLASSSAATPPWWNAVAQCPGVQPAPADWPGAFARLSGA